MDSFGDNNLDNLDNLMKDLANLTLNIIEECKKKNPQKLANMFYLMYKKEKGFMSSFGDFSTKYNSKLSEMTLQAFDIVQERIIELIKAEGWEEEKIEEFNEILNSLMNGYKDV